MEQIRLTSLRGMTANPRGLETFFIDQDYCRSLSLSTQLGTFIGQSSHLPTARRKAFAKAQDGAQRIAMLHSQITGTSSLSA